MRRLLPLLICIPTLSLAAGYGGATGTNSRGEIIHIAGEATANTIYVQKSRFDDHWNEQYDLRVECPVFTKAILSCLPGRKSPISGATYKITISKNYQPCNVDPFYDKSPGEVYVCAKGCGNPRAPKMFRVSPWEC